MASSAAGEGCEESMIKRDGIIKESGSQGIGKLKGRLMKDS